MLQCILGLTKIAYQGQLHSAETKRKYEDDSYRYKKVTEFNIQLTANHYINFQNVNLFFL